MKIKETKSTFASKVLNNYIYWSFKMTGFPSKMENA